MEKQTIIRGAAIVVAGIAASTYGAQHLIASRHSANIDAQATMQGQSQQVMGAGLMGNLSGPGQTGERSIAIDGTSFAALSDTQVVETGTDFAHGLSAAENTASPVTAVNCTPTLVSRPAVDALIELSLNAPCHTNERVVVSHDDLAFSAYTNEDGTFSAYLPALSADAKIDVFLSDDTFLTTSVQIDDVAAHARIVLQWTGEAAFSLHAYHRGARFGEDGHLHALKPFDPALDEAFLITLGENRGPEPMLSEIYSVPVHMAASSRVELELQFTTQQCGEELSAYILKTGTRMLADVKEARFATPECPAESGSLVMDLPMIDAQSADLSSAGVMLSDLQD